MSRALRILRGGAGSLQAFLHGLGDVIFPRACVHCGGLVEEGPWRHLCAACAVQVHFVGPPHCSICGHPFAGMVEGERRCPHCAGLVPAFRAGRTAVLFRGPVRSLLIELKYRRGWHVLEDLELMLRRSPGVLEYARGAVLVPVPLHPRKRRERGYNQSELIAGALARAAGSGARVELALRRVEDTPTQTAFGRQARRNNLKNAFALARGAGLNPGRRHVLVDDVFTTGSTINACALALRRAGCLKIEVVTLCHG